MVNRMFRKYVKDDLDIYASCSLGALVVNSQRVDSFDALFCQADRALYEAKKNGKGRVAIRNYDMAEADAFLNGGGV